MIYHIENEHFKVQVKEDGAELCSIQSKKTDREYIWQADPEIWGSSAPVLFPVIGVLKEGEYDYDGKKYSLPKHGIIRNNSNVKLINKTSSRLSFLFSSSEETLTQYPFNFDLKVSFFLFENKLQVFHEIVNLNEEPMHFSLGAHPAFNVPWLDGENYDDYYLEFERQENASIYEFKSSGLLGKKEIPFLENETKLGLSHDLFEKDAKIFTELSSNEVSIKSKTNKNKISINFDDFPFLALWAKPKGNFVCIEPWDGLPDYENTDKDFTTKPGNVKLTPGNTHYASYTIQIFEK
ncbi:MAG: aldose 1-epimerase family protein [Reichenbachiella sp.]